MYGALISEQELWHVLIVGRSQSYVRKSAAYNPYRASSPYDWHAEMNVGGWRFTDSYRGFNPYGGVEYVYPQGSMVPVWSCDYVGYVLENALASANDVYAFLREGRAEHLRHCEGQLNTHYTHQHEAWRYETTFRGDVTALLQIEEIRYQERIVARQVAAGRLREGVLLRQAMV